MLAEGYDQRNFNSVTVTCDMYEVVVMYDDLVTDSIKCSNPILFSTANMVRLLSVVVLACASVVFAFPSHRSLAGLSYTELQHVIPTLQAYGAEPPPGPLNDTSTKLVNNKEHPWKPLEPNEIRGPCPGLNTLASHGVSPKCLKSKL